jgi:hypothetical protein
MEFLKQVSTGLCFLSTFKDFKNFLMQDEYFITSTIITAVVTTFVPITNVASVLIMKSFTHEKIYVQIDGTSQSIKWTYH